MALVINTNMSALNAQKALNRTQDTLGVTIQRLSTGLRINSAKDDAAGLSIAMGMTASIQGMTQAARNANDGISLSKTTEGALTQVNENLLAIRRLSVQASNGTNSASDIENLQNEVVQRLAEIDRISQQTDFNGIKVLSANGEKTIQTGGNHGETVKIAMQKITGADLSVANMDLNAFATPATVYADYATTAATNTALKDDQHIAYPAAASTNTLDNADIKISANHAASGLATTSDFGTDFKLHQKIDKATGQVIDGQYVVVVGAGANAKAYEATLTPGATVANAKKLDITVGAEITGAQAGAVGAVLPPPTFAIAADQIISRLDDALTKVTTFSSSLGALQNRFEAVVGSLTESITNLSAARSRIQDADFADEVSRLSNGQILQQAGTTVLAMANQSTQSVLSLLR